jgi:hypothetical protein
VPIRKLFLIAFKLIGIGIEIFKTFADLMEEVRHYSVDSQLIRPRRKRDRAIPNRIAKC